MRSLTLPAQESPPQQISLGHAGLYAARAYTSVLLATLLGLPLQ